MEALASRKGRTVEAVIVEEAADGTGLSTGSLGIQTSRSVVFCSLCAFTCPTRVSGNRELCRVFGSRRRSGGGQFLRLGFEHEEDRRIMTLMVLGYER